MRLVLVSGLSGSGKSVVLKLLEDLGFFCVDNLPLTLVGDLIDLHQKNGAKRLAVSVDTRSGHSFECLPEIINRLKNQGVVVDLLFLEASKDILVQRFSETRRRHPLARADRTLDEAIDIEVEAMAEIRDLAHRIDTSTMSTPLLKHFVTEWLLKEHTMIHLVFESFGFKYGLPLNADFVFDMRSLPNPHYDRDIREFNGLDAPIIDYFQDKQAVWAMIDDVEAFIRKWLPSMQSENRSYVTVGIGCTGGKHRSVFISEALKERFADVGAQVRHRQLNHERKRG
ncbi:MAG: RNase adapter RapZ [Neisseriaceae bacterium]|nr:RNase adapter RapZ [Neisseriaceae bacterium]